MGRPARVRGTGRGRRPDPGRRLPVEQCAGRLTVRRYLAGKGRPADLGPVTLVTTRPHLGGERRWFACPGCARRVGVLYRPVPGAAWRCRGCHGLTYRSAQQAHRAERLAAGGGWDTFLRELSEAGLPDVEAADEAMIRALAAAIAGGGGWDAVLRSLSELGFPNIEDLVRDWASAEAGPGPP